MHEVGQLPEFDVVRLLETAHQKLRDSVGTERDAEVIGTAMDAVNTVLQAKHRSSTEDASEHGEQLRRAAHGLVPVAVESVQQALQAMLAAAAMCQ